MIRSIDIVTRNFNILQEKQKNLSANTANMMTPGFKYQQLIQSTLPESTVFHQAGGVQMDQRQNLGGFTFGNQIDEAYIHMGEGSLQASGLLTDFAINGEGFFTVSGPAGNLYTQNGRFTMNEIGQLVTREGYLVQMTGDARFGQDTVVDEQGYIQGTNAQFVVTSFGENTNNLVPADNGYFTGVGGVVGTANATIHQGYLESANIDIADIMVEMLQITREFEATQKVLQASNETLQKATNEVGKV